MIIYKEELKEFNKHKVQYIIVGGIAFNLLGGFRSTADLDIIIEMTPSNLQRIIGILSRHHYKLLQPIDPLDVLNAKKRSELKNQKNMKTLSFLKENSLNAVDIIFDTPVSFTKAKKNVIIVKIDGLRLPVIGLHELMTMKKTAWRPIDQADYAELKIIKSMKAKK